MDRVQVQQSADVCYCLCCRMEAGRKLEPLEEVVLEVEGSQVSRASPRVNMYKHR